MDRTVDMEPTERVRRFWTAHGRSAHVATVLVALRNNRAVAWTAEHLCVWYGIPLDRANNILQELESSGIIRRVGGADEAYEWSPELDWVGPLDNDTWRSVGLARRRRAGRLLTEP